MADVKATRTDWLDDEANEDTEVTLPESTEVTGADGITVITTWKFNEDNKRVKVTRRVRRKLQTQLVSHDVAERKSWAKFGADRGKAAGPDRTTTMMGENLHFKISAASKQAEPEPEAAKVSTGKGFTCRLCKGAHFTAKCPFKDQLEALDTVNGGDNVMDDVDPTPSGLPPKGAGGAGGKYVPPGSRPNASTGEVMGGRPGNRDDFPTLRIASLSVDADDEDLRNLFLPFENSKKVERPNIPGKLVRANVVRDHTTGESRGLGFVSFEKREDAEAAMAKMNGRGYDSLILSVSWSVPREQRNGA